MKPKSVKAESVIVIGAGVGGISAAAHLAKAGFHVTVIEKNSHAGGRCDRISRDGHHFDTGPTLFVMPKLFQAEYAALGVHMEEQLDLLRVDPTYHLVFGDGSSLALTSDMQSLQEQLEAIQPGSFHGFMRYMQEGQRHYQGVMDRLVDRVFRSILDFVTAQDLALIYRLDPLINHYQNISSYFADPRLKTAFTFQDMYMGTSPFDAPATYSMMQYTELAHGVWYPKGGMYRIVESLMDIARRWGVEFVFNTAVNQIELEGKRARGVRLADGRLLEADVVLANADLPYVYQQLLTPDGTSRALANKRFSCSSISFFWGLDRAYPALAPHTLFFGGDYRQSFESIDRDLSLPADPNIYIHAPARLDPDMAPPGQDTLIAIVPVGHLSENGDQHWSVLRDEARRQVFRRLRGIGIQDLEAHIKFEETFTPPTWAERYNLVKGSTHGLAHTLNQMICFRPSNRHPHIRNLYFAGASTHPGTGIPTAMVSGRITAQRIREDL